MGSDGQVLSPPKTGSESEKNGRKRKHLSSALKHFLADIKRARFAARVTTEAFNAARESSVVELTSLLKEHASPQDQGALEEIFQSILSKGHAKPPSGDKITIQISADKIREFQGRIGEIIDVLSGIDVVRASLLVAIVSRFDEFMADIINISINIKPHLVFSGDKTILLSQINDFSSLDEIKNHLIDREIDSILRGSRTEQFEWLEKNSISSLDLVCDPGQISLKLMNEEISLCIRAELCLCST